MDHTVWALQTRYFAHHGRSVLAVDLPGHGRSEGPAPRGDRRHGGLGGRLLEAAGLTEAALDRALHGRPDRAGLRRRNGEAAAAIALLGAAPAMPVHPDLLAAAEANNHLAYDLVTAWGHGPAGISAATSRRDSG